MKARIKRSNTDFEIEILLSRGIQRQDDQKIPFKKFGMKMDHTWCYLIPIGHSIPVLLLISWHMLKHSLQNYFNYAFDFRLPGILAFTYCNDIV